MKTIAERTEDFALRIVNACGWLESYLVEQKKFTFLELNKQHPNYELRTQKYELKIHSIFNLNY